MLILERESHCFTDSYIIHLVRSLDVDILKLPGDDNIQLCLKVIEFRALNLILPGQA